ncbi:MAG: tRNA dihydrouridine synthase DusB [Pseudomonadota bacterium]
MDPLRIGRIAIENRAILAPMSGVSDWPFRQLAHRFGAGLVVSEMVASERLIAREEEARLKLEGDGLPIHAVQLAGCRAEDLAEAARIAEGAGAHIIDINMGCPAKRVVGGWAGSALMRDVDHASRLIAATVAAVDVPVTVKMRLGYDRTLMTAPELAARAEAEGAQMITVHGRTRCQRYKGHADWPALRRVREAITIPLVANGDVTCLADARQILTESGADGVMIGRAAVGAPWLVGEIGSALVGDRAPPERPSLASLAGEHLERLCAHYGTALGLKMIRKHIAGYAAHLSFVDVAARTKALTAESLPEARAALVRLFAAPATPAPALMSAEMAL